MPGMDLTPFIRALTGDSPPRTWSMLVTIFGDLALQDGARLTGTALSTLTAPMGIRPEALRTALHRLRKEGWVESRRVGRGTDHGLTAWGRDEVRAAHPRIYDPPPALPAFLIVTEPGAPQPQGAIPVGPGLGVSTTPQGFALPLQNPPDWLRARLMPASLSDQTQRLNKALARFSDGPLPDLSVTDIAMLRVMVVHDWRRIALRLPPLPYDLFPDGWPGHSCRDRVMALLSRLPRPDPATLT